MKKTGLIVFVLAVTAAGVFAQSGTLDASIAALRPQIESALSAGARVLVVCNAPVKTVADYAADELSARLVSGKRLTVVERSAEVLNALNAESTYQLLGEVDDDTIQAIGHKTGAEYLISGNISNAGNDWRLVVKAVSVKKGELAGQWNAAFLPNAAFEALLAKGRPLPQAPDKPFSRDAFGGAWSGAVTYRANGQEYRDNYRISLYDDGTCWIVVTARDGVVQAVEGFWSAEDGVFHVEGEFEKPVIARLPGLRWSSQYTLQSNNRRLRLNVKPAPDYSGVTALTLGKEK